MSNMFKQIAIAHSEWAAMSVTERFRIAVEHGYEFAYGTPTEGGFIGADGTAAQGTTTFCEVRVIVEQGPLITGRVAYLPEDLVEWIKIDCPEDENWGVRKITYYPDGEIYNHGYRAGGMWVDAWTS